MSHLPLTLSALAALTGCQLVGDRDKLILGVADLEMATADEASFYENPRYAQAFRRSRAGVFFVNDKIVCEEGKNYLVSSSPSKAFQVLVDLFYPPRSSPSGFSGVHSSAVIHPTAKLGKDVVVAPQGVIDEGVEVGDRTFVGPGVYIGPGSCIGADCVLHARVVIREGCLIGSRVILQPGVVIGSCGFGYTTEADGRHTKLNQVGRVRIEDDVEVGANTTIDRARFQETVIGRGTKIDNLVQIAHGVRIGMANIIVAQTGIAGSTTTGRHVVLAGQVAVAGHLHLDDGVIVAGKSGVSKSLSKGTYGGIPAEPIQDYNRRQVLLRKLVKKAVDSP